MLGSKEEIPSGTPPVVIVTVMKADGYSKEYLEDIKDNRIQYARKHGKPTS
jgi:mannan polymerase II complex MNN11 subunit